MMTQNYKELRRQNGVVAGVCGGLADFFGLNPFWFRLAFFLVTITPLPPGFLLSLSLYIIMWIVVPRKA
jgi:phage shock protein C